MPRQVVSNTRKLRASATNNAEKTPKPSTNSASQNRLSRTRLKASGGDSRDSSRSTGSRYNPSTTPIIMTRAQLNRRRTLVLNTGNVVRSVMQADTDNGPIVTTRDMTPPAANTSNPGQFASSSNFSSSKLQRKPRDRVKNSKSSSFGLFATEAESAATSIMPSRIRAYTSTIASAAKDANQQKTSLSVLSFNRRKSRNRVTFDLAETGPKDSVHKVFTSEKILPCILGLMNWNELLLLRTVCKLWHEVIDVHPKVKRRLGTIVLRPEVESKMAVYNASSIIWNKFRFIGPMLFDLTKSVQNEFWNKHGPLMVHLEINNRSMTLTGLVEILARSPKLEYFKCNWTPEMYSFNSELIKKYYGIHFNNGTFSNLQDLTIEHSSSLTDSALWSMLKWCGGSIRTLKLTSPPDEDVLSRLKPRWSIESIKNYFDRFGYTGNLQYLDFSWCNLTHDDIRSLASIDMNLRGITLNYCRVDNEGLRRLLLKHGDSLEVLKIEGTPFTDSVFSKEILPKIKVLHIGGLKGMVYSLDFLTDMPHLEELSCHKTQWLEHNMVLRPLNSKTMQKHIKSLDFGGGIKHIGNKKLDPNLNRTWFSDFAGLIPNVRELNLSQWSLFGTDINFKNLCRSMTLIEKLVIRDWDQLTDVGTTGLYEEEIHQDWGSRVPLRPRIFIGLLKRLTTLDLSGTGITDASVNLGLYALKNLRRLTIDNTRITDNGLKRLINALPSLDRVSAIKCHSITLAQPRFKRADGRMVFLGKT